jgi:hypothetical protein
VKQMVPVQAYNRLKSHLNTLVKRHQAFRDTILVGGNFNNQNQFATVTVPPDFNHMEQQLGFNLANAANLQIPTSGESSNRTKDNNDDLVGSRF